MLSMTIDVYGTCSASNALLISALSPTGDPAHVLGAGGIYPHTILMNKIFETERK